MDIVRLAFEMAEAVEQFLAKVKQFYYQIMLAGCRCPKCDGSLSMFAEGRCRCDTCSHEFDPTVEFQRCSDCGGIAVLRVRRYHCKNCGIEITSKFLFDGCVFDACYFSARMAQSRQRKKQQRENVRKMLAECRSGSVMLEPANPDSVPGLVDALNSLTCGLEVSIPAELKGKFDLNRYQLHISSCVEAGPQDLRQIPPIIENLRVDLIWRFVATIFLEHNHKVNIRQQGQTIWVMKYDDRQGQSIPGEVEEADGLEGPEGRVQAW